MVVIVGLTRNGRHCGPDPQSMDPGLRRDDILARPAAAQDVI
jgi:hypothetical protein